MSGEEAGGSRGGRDERDEGVKVPATETRRRRCETPWNSSFTATCIRKGRHNCGVCEWEQFNALFATQ